MKIPAHRLLLPACVAALAALLPAAAHAQAATVPPEAMGRALALAADAARALAPAGARVAASPGLGNPRLMLAPCQQAEPYLPAGVPPWGRTRVGLRCVAGAVKWNVTLPITVEVRAPALAASAALPAGARLEEIQLEKVDADWASSALPFFTAPESLAGRTLARAVAAGQPLRASDLQPRQWFAAGEPVRVLAVGEGFAVSAEGLALTPGIEGQPARVRMAGDRIVIGRPVAGHQVEVGP